MYTFPEDFRNLLDLNSVQVNDWLLELQPKLGRQIRGDRGHLWQCPDTTLRAYCKERWQWYHGTHDGSDPSGLGLLADSSDDSA